MFALNNNTILYARLQEHFLKNKLAADIVCYA